MDKKPDQDAIMQKVNDLLSLAEHFFELQSYEDAYYLYQKLESFPEYISQHEIARKIATCLYHMGRYDEVLNPFSALILENEDIEFLNKLADRFEEQDFINEAEEVLRFINQKDVLFTEYVRKQKAHMDLNLALQQGQYLLHKRRFQEAMRQFQLAMNLGYSDYERLLKNILEYEEEARKDAHYWLGKAQIYLKMELYSSVAECWEVAITLLGRKDRQNLLSELEKVYHKALHSNPDDAELQYRLGKFYTDYMSDYEKAEKYFQFLLRDKEYEKLAATRLGIIAFRRKNYRKALEFFERGELERDHFEILYALGTYYEGKEELYYAYRAYSLINNIEPDYKKISLKIHSLKSKFKTDELERYNIPATTAEKNNSPLKGGAARRYEYLTHLGSGGMGNVYKVHDLIQDEIVALKLIVPRLREDSEALQHFFKEAQLASSLEHPSIIEIYDFGFEPKHKQSYITMEYVDGKSLRTIIQEDWDEQDELTTRKIKKYVPWLVQLLEALKVSHEKGIIHRDIKPDNILIARDTIKVTDFGIACLRFGKEDERIRGTPKYMSPEQISGDTVDERTDIYSVGILMYELFSGEPPFNIGDIPYQQLHVDPLSLQEIYPAMPREMNKMMLKCLQKKATERYQSVSQLLKDLERVV